MMHTLHVDSREPGDRLDTFVSPDAALGLMVWRNAVLKSPGRNWFLLDEAGGTVAAWYAPRAVEIVSERLLTREVSA